MGNLMTGAAIVFKALEEQGVDTIFGYPGGAVLPIYDELKNHKKIRHFLVRHEQGAGHAAEGYARSSGKPGIVLVTSGPGATNVVTALTDAYMDSIPIVCITGQVPTHLIGTDAFQECDTTGITRPCTKHNWLVKDVKNLSKVLKNTDWQNHTWENDEGKFDQDIIILETGETVAVECYDWSKDTENNLGWVDNLRVQISSAEWEEMLYSQ